MSETISLHGHLEIVREEIDNIVADAEVSSRAAATATDTESARGFAIQAREHAGKAIGKFMRVRRDVNDSVGIGSEKSIDNAIYNMDAAVSTAVGYAEDADDACIRLMRVFGKGK